MTETEPPPQTNGIHHNDEYEKNKVRPADIEADMHEMERRKRVEAIMQSRLFHEELERIVDSHVRKGVTTGLQPLSDMVEVPAACARSVCKSSNFVLPINDIRGVGSMGYAKGEKTLRCKVAATIRLLDLHGYTQCLGAQVTARLLNADQELFLMIPHGLLSHEVTASSLNKVDMQGNVVQHGTTKFGINSCHYALHLAVYASRSDIRCAIYVGCSPVVAVSGLRVGLLPLTQDAVVLGEVPLHKYTGALQEPEEREKLVHSLGPISKVLLLTNHGALCCGETIEEAFYVAYHLVQACETQLKMLPIGIDHLNLIPEEERKAIYDSSRRPPEGYELRANHIVGNSSRENIRTQFSKWRVGGVEFDALMRMLDNAGFQTGFIYRNPPVNSELSKPRSDVGVVPPAVSSISYPLEEKEIYRQGIWKKSDMGIDRTRCLYSPNVYQKVQVLQTGTPDPKKITKWVADCSPTHSMSVRTENPMQFVPPGTNPKELKKLQHLIKDNRRTDKISAGPQSPILEDATWDEVDRIRDASNSWHSDHVVLMGAASKGIIQRDYQHNASVYKTPYVKNPFDSVTDDELNEYKKGIERKRHGYFSDPQVHRKVTKIAPEPTQPEVMNEDFLSSEPPSDKALLRDNQSLIPRRLYVELEDYIAAKVTRNPKLDDVDHIAIASEQDASDLDISDITFSYDYITIVAEPSSPFRTVSHFGFNSPAKNPNPSHFHVPIECTKYVGVTTEFSIDELFATNKYLEYPDDLVPLIQRRKKLSRSIIRGRVERRRRSPPKPFAILNGCREYLVHGCGQQPHQSYIKMLEKYFTETPYSRRKEEARDDFEKTVHALVTKMIDLAADEPDKLNTIDEEASVDFNNETIASTYEVQSDLITIEVQPNDINSVVTSVPIKNKSAYDNAVLKPAGKLEVTSMVENFMKQLAESRFSNESPNLDYQPDEISTPKTHNRSLLSRSDREARRAEFIELWEDHLDYVCTQERLAIQSYKANNTSPSKDQNINDDLNSLTDSMENLDEIMEDLISSTVEESSDSYEPIERTIIDKINLHGLDQDDEIFTKIKQTIYDHNNSKQVSTNEKINLTPPANKNKFRTSTPTDTNVSQPIFTQNFKQVRRTSTPKKIDSGEEALAVKATKKRPINKSFEQNLKAKNGYTTVSSDEEHTTTASRTRRKPRNFIAENIKKVSARGNTSTTTRGNSITPLKASTKSKTAVKSFLKNSTKSGSSLLWLSVSTTSTGSSNAALNNFAGNAQSASIDDLSKQFAECSSSPSADVSLNIVNRLLNDHVPTHESAEVLLPNDTSSVNVMINAADQDYAENAQSASIDGLSEPLAEFSSSPSADVSFNTAEVPLQIDTSSANVTINAAEHDFSNDPSPINNEATVLAQKCTEHIANLRLNEINLDMDEIFQIQNDNIAEQAAERDRCEAEIAENWRSFKRISYSLSEGED